MLCFFSVFCFLFFFFKQKTAYEIRNCDWSSDVCSSDLVAASSQAGSATLTLTATDSHGASTSDDVTIQVVAPTPTTPTTTPSTNNNSSSSGGSISIWLLGDRKSVV